jgi:hypothetical protein
MFNWAGLYGLIPILGGVYGLLLANGVLQMHPKDTRRSEEWRRKYGRMMMVAGPILIVVGLAQVAGLFRS